jgi:hypothetical protein
MESAKENNLLNSHSEFIFELTADFENPCKKFLPALYYNNHNNEKSEIYFCLINVVELRLILGSESKFIKLEFCPKKNEPKSFEKCN